MDIGDANMFVLRNKKKGIKEVIISYKTIFINTYNITCLDTQDDGSESLIFRHESFQLWESQISGILTHKNNDFIKVNRDGIAIIALGAIEKRKLRDAEGAERMIHSLESMNYLKVDPGNFLLFAC